MVSTEFIKNNEEKVKGDLIALSDTLYENPELSGKEYKSKALHEELLKKYGFSCRDVDGEGLETAFIAEYDSGKPGRSVGYLAEYDALPGIGHGCGHNMLGAISTGAAILLSKVVDETGGKVVLFGTPAEETYGGKILMAEKGCFDDVDVGMMSHASTVNKISGGSLAYRFFYVEFHGKTAHAAADPEKGINALSAMNLVFAGINTMRETVAEDVRLHGMVTDGGKAANIIPDYASGEFYVRARRLKTVNEVCERFFNILRGAELMTGAKVKWREAESFYDLNTNQKLSEVCTKYMEEMGMTDIDRDTVFKASLDMGNVSYHLPSIHPYFDITQGVDMSNHSVEFAAATTTDYAHDQLYKMASALALTGYEVLTDPELLEAIKEEFAKTTKLD